MTTTDLAHCASLLCSVAAARAFSYLSDPARLGEWALGCWGAADVGSGVVRGTSLFDGSATFARPVPNGDNLIVDFEVGNDPGGLVRRISTRVVPGDQLGVSDTKSLVLLTAWRIDSMDNDRWQQLVAAHQAEVLLLRHRLETVVP